MGLARSLLDRFELIHVTVSAYQFASFLSRIQSRKMDYMISKIERVESMMR